MPVLFQPRMALKIPQPPPPLNSGLQHCNSGQHSKRISTTRLVYKTYIDMPYGFVDVVRTGPDSKFRGVASDDIVPVFRLETYRPFRGNLRYRLGPGYLDLEICSCITHHFCCSK